MTYDSLSMEVVQRTKISELSGRDKVKLFNDLMDNLGITKRLNEQPNTMRLFETIWKEQTKKAWTT